MPRRKLSKDQVLSKVRQIADDINYPVSSIGELSEQVGEIAVGGKSASINDLRGKIRSAGISFPITNKQDLVNKSSKLFDKLKADHYQGPGHTK